MSGRSRLAHKRAGDADIDGVVYRLPRPLYELEALGDQGPGDERQW
jgi:hypothetical protein